MNTLMFVLAIGLTLSTIWYLGLYIVKTVFKDRLNSYNIRFEVTGYYNVQELRRMAQSKVFDGFYIEAIKYDDVLVKGRHVGTVIRGTVRQSPECFFMDWLTGANP